MAISNRNVLSRQEKERQLAELMNRNRAMQVKQNKKTVAPQQPAKRDVKDAVPYAGSVAKNSKALDYESKAKQWDSSGFSVKAVKASSYTDENKKRQGLNYIINDNYKLANRGKYNQLDYLQDDEIKTVKHLISTAGEEDYSRAYDYLDSIERVLNERMANSQTAKAGDFAKENNLMGAAMSLVTGMAKPLGYLGALEQGIENFAEGKDELIDPNSPYFAGNRVSDAYAQGVMEDKSDLAKFLIGTGLSMGNQLMTLPMGAASLAFMGLQGAGDAAFDYAQKGIETGKALLGATGSGAITYATERMLPNERLFGLGDNARDVLTEGALKHIFKSALGEGVEEVEENVLDNAWDYILMGEKSDFSTLKNQLMEQGLTESEATLQATKQLYVDNSIEGFLGGALSGGLMGGMGSGANYIRASRMGRRFNNPETVEGLISEGSDIRAGSRAEMLAAKNREKLDSKGRLSDSDVGKQIIANQQAQGELEQEQEKINIRLRYRNMAGKDADANVVDSLHKIFSGGALSNNEAEAIINDESGRKMFSEKTGVAIPENATMAQKRRAVKSFAEKVASGVSEPVVIDNRRGEVSDDGRSRMPAPTRTVEETMPTKESAPMFPMGVKAVKVQPTRDSAPQFPWSSTPEQAQAIQEKKQIVSHRGVRFGDSGRKAFSAAMKGRSGNAMDGAMKEFELYYMAGSAGLGMDSVERRGSLNDGEVYAAYQSGVNDSEFSRKGYERKVAVKNENAGFNYDGSVNIEAVTADNLDKVGKAMGVKITVVDKLTDNRGKSVNGKYNTKTGEFILSADNENGIEFVALHEMVHRLRLQDRKTFYELGKKVMGYMQANNLLTGEVARQAKLYGLGKGDINYYDLLEEVVADFIGGEYDLQTVVGMFTDRPKSFVQKVIDLIDDIIDSIKKALGMDVPVDRLEDISAALQDAVRAGANKKAATSEGDGDVRYSKKGSFIEQLEEARNGGLFEESHLMVRANTPKLYERFGLNIELPMLITKKHALDITTPEDGVHTNYHGITDKQLKAAVKGISEPALVFESVTQPGRLVVVTAVVDDKKRPIIMAIKPNARGNINTLEYDTNLITSLYGKDSFVNFFVKNITNDNLLYHDKEKSRLLSNTPGVQFPNNIPRVDFNKNIQKFKQKVNGKNEPDSGARFSYAGSNADTADRENLQKARDMMADNESIRQQTGWFKGADGVWRFEIDDSKAVVSAIGQVNMSQVEKARMESIVDSAEYREYSDLLDKAYFGSGAEGRQRIRAVQQIQKERPDLRKAYIAQSKTAGSLEEFMQHDELFRRYPALKRLDVIFDIPADSSVQGGYDGNWTIRLNKALQDDEERLKSVLLHEIQHFIQQREGFENGSNPTDWANEIQGIDSSISMRERAVAKLEGEGDDAGAEMWRGQIEELKKKKEKYAGRSAFDLYQSTYGEQEARDVQARMNMSADERKQNRPFTGDENTVFRFSRRDNMGNQLSAQQQRYFADSKVRDANGALMVVYHQTDADFTQFRTKSTGAGRYDHQMPDGIFTKPGDNDIGLKGKRQMALYANITNPLMFNNRQQAEMFWKDNIDGYGEIVRQLDLLDIEYHEKYEAADLLDDELYKNLRQQLRDKKITREEFSEGLEKTETKKILKEWEEKGNRLRARAKQLINEYISASDYDGLIMENDQGSFGRRVKSIVAFSSNQLKNVTNANPTDSDDIRFSKKQEETADDYAGMDVPDSPYSFRGVSRHRVEKQAVKIRKEHGTTIRTSWLTAEISDLYNYIQRGADDTSGEFSFDEAYTRARAIAKEVVDNAVVQTDEYGGEYVEVKNLLKGLNVYVPAADRMDFAGYENYGEFRRKTNSKIKQTNKGTPVDIAYSKMSGLYPGVFPEDITHPAEQLMKLVEVYDNLKTFAVNPYEGYENEVIDALATEIFDNYFTTPQQKRTYADQLEVKLQEQIRKTNHLKEKLEQLKAEKEEEIRQLKLLYKKQYSDLKNALKQQEQATKLQNEILDIAGQFKRWYKGERDAGYLSHPVLDEYIKELGKLKYRSDIRKASARNIFDNLQGFYKEEVLGEYYEPMVREYIEFIAENRYTDGKPNVQPLSYEELQYANYVVRAIRKLYQEYDTVVIGGKRERARDLARKEYGILDKYGRSDVKVKFFNYLVNKALTEGLFNAVETRVVYQTLEGFHEEGVLKMLHDDMTAGVTKSNKLRIEMLRSRDEFLQKHKDYRTRLEKEKISFRGVEMTVGQAVTAYLTMHREEAKATLTSTAVGSGFDFKDKKGRVSHIQAVSDVDVAIAELKNLLSKEDLEYAEIAKNIFNEKARNIKVKADMDILGFSNVSDSKWYIPIRRSTDQIAQAFSDVRRMVRDVASVYNFSFNKATVKHTEKAIEIIDINALLDNHCGKVAMYAGLTQPLQAFDRVLNSNIAVDTEGKKHGEQNLRDKLNNMWKSEIKGSVKIGGFENYHKQLMQDVQSRGRGDSSRLVNRVKSNFASAALGANLKEIISQPTGYFMAYQYLSGEAMAKGATMANDYDSMMKYSDYAMVRDYDKGYLLSESLADKVEGFAKKFGEPLDWADKYTMGKLWNACRVEVELKQGLKIGTEENYIAAAELLEKVGRLTQPNYDASEKSGLQRNKNEIISSFSMFSSVQTKQLSRIVESITKYQMFKERAAKEPTEANKNALAAAKEELTRCTVGILMMNAGYVLICSLVKAALPKKEEEKITDAMDLTKKMGAGLIESCVGMIPFADDAANMFIDGYDAGHFFYSAINDMASAIRGMKNVFEDPGKTLYNLAVATGQLTGIPTRNISNVLKGAINRGASALGTKGEYVGNKLIYTAFGGEKKNTYINLLYNALYAGDSDTAKYIIDDMVKRGYTKQSISTSLKTLFAQQAVEYWAEGDSENLQKVFEAMSLVGLSQKNISSQIQTQMKKRIVNDKAIVKLAQEISRFRHSDADWQSRNREKLQTKIDKLIREYAEKGYNQSVVTAAIESLIE